jgi:threonine dehydrogenase-like Zn-dependent dehydrogenase
VTGQLTVHTVFGASSGAWTHAVRAFAAGVLRPHLLITRELPLDDVATALTGPDDRADGTVKVLIRP